MLRHQLVHTQPLELFLVEDAGLASRVQSGTRPDPARRRSSSRS
jgi:hypothetical protein